MAEVYNDQEARELADAIHAGALTGSDAQAATAALERYAAKLDRQPAASTPGAPTQSPIPEAGETFNLSPEDAKASFAAIARAPGQLFRGAGQAVVRAGKALGLVSPEYAKQYESALTENTAAFEEKHGPGYGTMSDLMSGAIPIGGTALAAERAGGKMLGYLWELGKAGVAGGTVAATAVTPEDQSKLGDIAVGTAFPFAAQALTGAGTAAKNVITSAIRAADEMAAPRIARAREQAAAFWKGSNITPEPYTVAQSSGNPVLARLEFQAKGPLMNELMARQLDKTQQRFEELAAAAQAAEAGAPAGAANIAGAVNKTVNELHREMQSVATTGYKNGLDEVEALAAGSAARVRMTNLQDAYKSILAEKDNPFTLGGSHVPKDVKAAFELVSKMNRMDMGADAGTVAKILKGISANVTRGETVLTPAEQAMNRYAATLRAALEKDLAEALSARQALVPLGQTNTTRDPFDRLDEVRKEYAQRKEAISRLENDRISKLFGSEEKLATPREALTSFYALEPEDMKFAVGVMETRSPEILAGMRADRLREILVKSNAPGAASDATFDPAKFRQFMYDGKDGVVNTVLWDDATRKRMIEGAGHLSILQNSMSGMGGTPFAPSDVIMNAVGLNPIFTTRMVTRLAYGKYGDQLLGTPEGLAALRTFSSVGKTDAQAKAQAAAWILNNIDREGEE